MPNVLRLIYILLIVEGPEPDQGSRCGVMSQVWCTGGARYISVMQRVLCPAGCWLSLLSACTVNLCLVHCPSGPPSPFHGGCSAARQSRECNAGCFACLTCRIGAGGLSHPRCKALHSPWLEIMKIL